MLSSVSALSRSMTARHQGNMNSSSGNDHPFNLGPEPCLFSICAVCENITWPLQNNTPGITTGTAQSTDSNLTSPGVVTSNSIQPSLDLISSASLFTDREHQSRIIPPHTLYRTVDRTQSRIGPTIAQAAVSETDSPMNFEPTLAVSQKPPNSTLWTQIQDGAHSWTPPNDSEPTTLLADVPFDPTSYSDLPDQISRNSLQSADGKVCYRDEGPESVPLGTTAREKRFICPHTACGAAFTSKNDLARHLATLKHRDNTLGWQEKANRFFCAAPSCKRSSHGFSRKDHCINHMKRMHPDVPVDALEGRI